MVKAANSGHSLLGLGICAERCRLVSLRLHVLSLKLLFLLSKKAGQE